MAAKSVCKIPECGKSHEALGYCRSHYRRVVKYGDPLAGRTPIGEPLAFLFAHATHQAEECLIWPYSTFGTGEARVRYGGRDMQAARLVCILAHGEPPTDRHEAAHNCGKGRIGCINQGHLRWATPSENQMDRVEHGTSNRGERHGASKLTVEQVTEIKRLRGRETGRSLARRHGVHAATICDIHRGRIWSWLEV